jgi:DNA-binding beta-propeller fold protein YncE
MWLKISVLARFWSPPSRSGYRHKGLPWFVSSPTVREGFTRINFEKSVVAVLFSALLMLSFGFYAPTVARIECVAGCEDGPLGGPAVKAKLIEPFGVAFDKAGRWYICEYQGHRITRVSPGGEISLFAGMEQAGYNGDGGPASRASLKEPHGLAVAGDQMYVADTSNHCIRKIDLKSGIITTIAGTGKAGFSGDGGAAIRAEFNGTFGIAVNREGDRICVADLGNRRIRLLDLKSGKITTVAGNGAEGVPSDGSDAAASPLVDPRAVALDAKGNVYILERRGNALRVVDPKGKIRTLIGPSARDNPPLEPRLNGPKHLCVDLKDNVIIADSENHLIRKYLPKEKKTLTIAGTVEKGAQLTPEDALKTQLNRPHGVYVHTSGAP